MDVRMPDGTIITGVPDNITQTELSRRYGLLQGPKQEESGILRQAADVPVGIAKGVTSGVRMLSDIFGANNPVSQALQGAEGYLNDLMSAQARNDQQEIARIMKDAEDKGVLDQVKAGVQAFATAPVDLLSQAAGTAIPIIAGGLAGSVAKLSSRVVGGALGAGMGTGVVKGTIYEETKQALKDAGVSEDQAEARAQLAQSYGGKNLDQILLGTALGGLTAVYGVEPAAIGAITRKILGKEGAEAMAQESAKELAKQASKSVVRRAVETGAEEAIPEFLQAAQERIASNLAQQREGLDVDTFRGAIASGTLEGLAGLGLGAGVGAVTKPPIPQQKLPEQTRADQEARLKALDEKAEGTESRTITTPDGKEVTIPGRQAEFLTDAERQERDRLRSDLGVASPATAPETVPETVPGAAPLAPGAAVAEEPAVTPGAVKLPYRNQNQQRVVDNIMRNYDMAPDTVAGWIEEGRINLGKDGKFTANSLAQLRAIGEIERDSAALAKPTEQPTPAPTATVETPTAAATNLAPLAEPTKAPAPGMVRLYRAESNPNAPKKSPAEWVQEDENYKRSLQAEGRWFTDSLDEANWYLQNEYPGGRITYMDIPADQAEQFRVSNFPEKVGGKGAEESPRAFSRRPEIEFFVSPELAKTRQLLEQSAAPAAPAQPSVSFTISNDGITGYEVDPSQVPNGNAAFQYAVGRVEPNGPEAIFRRSAQERGTYGGWRYENNLFNLIPTAKPAGVQLNLAEQKKQALQTFKTSLLKTIPSFSAQHSSGRISSVKPKPLSPPRVKLLIQLAQKALDLGLPPSVLTRIKAAGTTGMDSIASIATRQGWLFLGKHWGGTTHAEQLSSLIHELGHVSEFKNEQERYSISHAPEWNISHQELNKWYDRDPNSQHPLAYPFHPSFKRRVPDKKPESFAQAFALYFVDPVNLETNAPAAYNYIKSFVERINNEPARAELQRGAPATETVGVDVRERGVGKGPKVQPTVGQISPGVSRTELIGNQRAEVIPLSSILGRKKKAAPQRTAAGQSAMDVVTELGRQSEVTPAIKDRINQLYKDIKENPSLSKERAKQAVIDFLDKVETKVFSTDAALNNAIRRMIQSTTMSNEEKIGMLLSISSNQATHADALASLFIQHGSIQYNPELYKYEAVDNEFNFPNLSKSLDEIAFKYGLTKEEAERVAHTFFEARRSNGLMEFNEAIDAQVFNAKDKLQRAKDEGDENAEKLAQQELAKAEAKYKYVHMDRDQIDAGLDLLNKIPELERASYIWNGIRQNTAKVLVDSGLWSEEEAELLLSNMDYVPFYREEQLEQGQGPKEFLRGLQVPAKEKKLKGSNKPVADIFDNMARWTQYAVKRSVMNKLAQAKVNAAVEFGLATPVEEKNKGPNSVRVWENGKAQFYDMQDPLFMEAFAGLESVSLPIWKFFAKMSNFLRQSVVLYPLFSVSQVPQDAFAAMFSSGLKARFALTIPARAVKEFVNTLRKSSATHETLRRYGAVGVKDFSSAVARQDAEIAAGLKPTPGIFNKVKGVLEHISMASDNAVRQAVYSASIDQGLSSAEAIEKAFAIINFRNRGGSPTIRMLGQVVPFFNAYLAAQHVAIKTISGVGISPSARSEALKTLAATTGAVMALSMMYAMAMDDDDDYINKPSVMRDRLFIIPGTGMTIPIRTDIFSMPKILTEHMYMMLTDQGMEDGRKFRDSMKAALGNMLLGPTPVPQAIKPLVEVGVNYNFFQGRPLIGTFQKGLDLERQFNDSTSELAKLFGKTGLVSPIAADHLFRGMLGSLGGLILFTTNPILHSATDIPRPEMSLKELTAALPGTSGFVSRPFETGLKNDFYVLRDEVSKAANTFNDIKRRSPYEVEAFLANEDNVTRVGMQKAVNKITQDLSKIRKQISLVTNLPEKEMSAAEKRELINELKQTEQEMMKAVDIKELRKMANL